jgi:hypothetical protein
VALFGLLAAGLGVHTFRAYSPAAPSYPLTKSIELGQPFRTWAEHDRVRAEKGTPYVLQISAATSKGTGTDDREAMLRGVSTEDAHGWEMELSGSRLPAGGALLYYGASHQSDPANPQVGDIEARWDAFRPTIALCEGRQSGYFLSPLIERFAGRPEPAVVHGLARRNGVKLLSLEASVEDETAELLSTWPPETLLLYYTLRVYASESGGQSDPALAEHLLKKRARMPGLEGALEDLAAVEGAWQALGYPPQAWLSLKDLPQEGVLAEIGTEVQHIRGQHMARTLIELSMRGERVFAVVGSGHVIRQEWALRDALGARPADDQATAHLR